MTVAAATYLDPASEAFAADVLAEIDEAVPVWEAFLVGSEAVGGFDFTPISPDQLRGALLESIAWSESRPADSEFARVNAKRAWHYLDHGEWISKVGATP